MRRVVVGVLGTLIGASLLICLKSPERPLGSHVACAPPDGAPLPTPKKVRATGPKRTILGDPYPAKDFGDVQVKVVLTGSHIDDVVAVKMSGRPLNAPAVLRQEVLARQAARLTNVSGATYTCAAYQHSVQSALDKT